jgi:hypothetical protein
MTNTPAPATKSLYLTDGTERTFTVGETVTYYVGATRSDVIILGFPDGLVEWAYLGSRIAHVSLGGVFVKGLKGSRRRVEELVRGW